MGADILAGKLGIAVEEIMFATRVKFQTTSRAFAPSAWVEFVSIFDAYLIKYHFFNTVIATVYHQLEVIINS